MRAGLAYPMLAILAALSVSDAALGQEVHYSPEERLDTIDAALIGEAKRSVDLASYALTNGVVLDALNAAERREVIIRIVLDPRERHDSVALGDLSDNVRIKRGGPFMHLKAYAIDGEVLRTGSANFSSSGERAQDKACAAFFRPRARTRAICSGGRVRSAKPPKRLRSRQVYGRRIGWPPPLPPP